MNTQGYVKINRKILNWRWYKKPTTFRLFLHLILTANYADADFETHTIKRGQLVTCRKKLAEELNISEREVRTAINHLKATNDIAVNATSKYSIITVLDYEKIQQETSEGPTRDQQMTSNQPQYNKNKKNNKNNKGINNYRIETEISHVDLFNGKSKFND